MNTQYAFLLTVSLLSCSLAKPATVFLGYQDSLGQYSFGYSAPGSARSEVRTLNGATRGAYSYVDGNGVIQSAQYAADSENGFRVVATNLPEAPLPVQETAEVLAARAAHLQAVQLAEESQNEQEAKIESKNSLLKDEEEKKDLGESEIPKDESIITKSIPNEEEEMEKVSEEDKLKGQEAVEVTSSRSSQIINSHIAGVPVIPSQLVTPQIISQSAVPIFRVAEGNHEIEPSNLEESLNAQASSITPAGTALTSDGSVGLALTRQSSQENLNGQEEKDESLKSIITPVNVIPLSSSYSNFVRYAPALRYITYTIL